MLIQSNGFKQEAGQSFPQMPGESCLALPIAMTVTILQTTQYFGVERW
jgi:hypothetical protein